MEWSSSSLNIFYSFFIFLKSFLASIHNVSRNWERNHTIVITYDRTFGDEESPYRALYQLRKLITNCVMLIKL